MNTAAIAEHAIVGNMRSAALVNVYGEIDFFCFPEFDSPSVFASLLDSERAGCFSIRPAGRLTKASQLYIPETNVLLTRFLLDEKVLELCDFMPVGGDLPHCIMRRLTAAHGSADVEVYCRPSFDYSRAGHGVERCHGGMVFSPTSFATPAMRLLSSVETA